MEFVLYATVIAGTITTNRHQHNGSHCAAYVDDDGDPTTSSSSFVTELLYCFLSATKDCIRLNCRRYIAADNSIFLLTVRWFSRSDRQ
jgi:hypothetical protein